jgi:hypothetical protein
LEKEDPNEEFYIGDIVGVRNGKISRNTDNAEQLLSISFAPIMLGNMPPDSAAHNFEKVGFMGQVPMKIRGGVSSGDYIIPSGKHDGEGIAIAPEDLTIDMISKVVGRSWSTSDYEGISVINAVIGVKSYEIVEVVKKEQERLNDLEAMVKELQEKDEARTNTLVQNSQLLKELQEKNEAQASSLVENTKILKELQGILEAEAKR